MTGTFASPVGAAVRVVQAARAEDDGPVLHSRAEVPVHDSEIVFAGHYPDFPIFPGVCVVECVHRAALATAPPGGLSLAALDSARFVGAVFPGDVLAVEIDWKPSEDGWTCTGQASTDRGVSANVRLRYRTGVPA